MDMQPLIFEPIYKAKIWGGDRIFTHFGRPKPSAEPIGESWELADLEEDQSRVRGSGDPGTSLAELRETWGRDLLGPADLFEGRFPLLIKFLDAQTSLSVQVHPNEAVARRLGGKVRVKNEAWYVLAADPGGAIYHGLESGVDADRFRQAMETGRIEDILRKIEVEPGQCYYVPSGTPHALGAGVLVAEIQTPSDITYRTYDWGRVDPKTGQPRELHLDQAMECISFGGEYGPALQPTETCQRGSARVTRCTTCDSFTIDQVSTPAGAGLELPGGEMVVWMVLDGAGRIDGSSPSVAFKRGDTVLLPAGLGDVRVRVSQEATWLEARVPASA